MKKFSLISVSILISVIAYSQSKTARRNYEKGTKAIASEKYVEGIRFLTLSINEFPNPNTYYKRATAYNSIGDTCNFCSDLKNASDLRSEILFNEKCTYFSLGKNIQDTSESKSADIKYFLIIHNKCNTDTIVKYISSNEANNFISSGTYIPDPPEPFTIVEEMPYFPGGEKERTRFINNTLIYPLTAKNNMISGTVYVSFIVNSNGSLTDVKVLKGIGGGCDEEAVRIVKMMPKWNPGKQSGKPVRVIFNMPIVF